MSGRRAFTLVELLVSSAMLAMLAMAGYAVLSAGVRSSQKARRLSSMIAHGQRALTVMATDIRAAVEHGDVRLTALDAQYEGLAADTIDFIALRTRRSEDPDAVGRCEVGYYIDNDPDTEAQWLIRREDATIDDDPLEGGTAVAAGPYVSELDLRFYDGSDWLDGWSDSEYFPGAVRIAILVADADSVEDPLCLETTVSIPAR